MSTLRKASLEFKKAEEKAKKKEADKKLERYVLMKARDKRIAEGKEKAKEKEAQKKLKLYALMKAQDKIIAASIKGQKNKQSTNIVKRLNEKLGSKRIQEKNNEKETVILLS